MKNKIILIIVILALLALAGYWYSQKPQESSKESSTALDKKRQDCIDKYGTQEDPLGLSDDADPRLAECLKQVDPNNPLGI